MLFRSRELMITFCDLGVGIPATLPKLYTWERIWAAVALLPGIKPNDGQMIQAGMVIGRTQTHETNRGKGLNDLRKFIDEAGGGEMNILSGQGSYRYRGPGDELVNNFHQRINGTLIKWTVPLDNISNWTVAEDLEHEGNDGH